MVKSELNITLEKGSVWLAGAGPGDPGLLTLHALSGMNQADIIVYDALVSKEVLKLANPLTPLEFAGKRGGKPSPKQVDISLRLVQLARLGKRVLRLKGGDPFVFGRGGEEATTLFHAGIPFRIIPGITSGIGGLAYAGIPLTHRDTNHAVTLVTGHDTGGGISNIDWPAISKSAPVVVIYMAMRHLDSIIEAFLTEGRPRDEPMAIISNASMPNQTVLETTLATCSDNVKSTNVEAPSIVVIGKVVNFRSMLNWIDTIPSPTANLLPFADLETERTG
ncbi:MAG: uroporphyrinogen-III C-methyltransferase [Rhodospirillaceae bacterium]|nr:uroporphyrinogen-III C-methyltransferase [Rhodospirillaceae bacterium]|tara:strand:+ start:161 stop:994 length:834 start_codon:yes stop_codon:yes gene_type:complete